MKSIINSFLLLSVLIFSSCTNQTETLKQRDSRTTTREFEPIPLEEWIYYRENQTSSTSNNSSQQTPEEINQSRFENTSIASFQLQGVSLEETVKHINKQLNKQRGQNKFSLHINKTANDNKISADFYFQKEIYLDKLLIDICLKFNVKKIIRNNRVIIGAFKPQELFHKRIYNLTRQLAVSLKKKNLIDFFGNFGAGFPKGAHIELISGKYLLVNNTPENHLKIEKGLVAISVEIDHLVVVAQVIEITKPALLRGVAVPQARKIMAVPPKYRKLVSRVATVTQFSSEVSSSQQQECFVFDEKLNLQKKFLGETLTTQSILELYGIYIKVQWAYTEEKSRQKRRVNGKDIYVSTIKEYKIDQNITLWDGDSAVLPLESTSNTRKFLVISPLVLGHGYTDALSNRPPHPLSPNGESDIFQNIKTGEVRIFMPEQVADYVKRLREKRRKESLR